MKIAVLSDIHGNEPALTAVIEDLLCWQPDKIIINGDIISRGPYSKKVLDIIAAEIPDSTLLTGNHETFVLHCADNRLEPHHERFEFQCFAQWTAEQVGDKWLEKIRTWADHFDMTDLDGDRSFHVTHGSRVGNRDGISAKTSDKDLPAKLGETRDLFVASHTHMPMIRHFNGSIVVNIGSVGQPLDNDARASYGQFELHNKNWRVKIARVVYDKAQAEQDFYNSGFLDIGGPVAQLIFFEHRHSSPYVGPFMRKYLAQINDGEITLASAVKIFLSDNSLELHRAK